MTVYNKENNDKQEGSGSGPILVLGASGFIGGSLVEYLKANGQEAIALSSGECDLLNKEALSEQLSSLTRSIKIVFCAGITPKRDNSFEAMLKNIQMIQSFGEAVSNVAVDSIVYLSSVDVYGSPPGIVTEESPISPRGYHGLAKLSSEIIFDITPSFSMPVTILRLPGIYGLGDRQKSIVGSFLNRLSNDEPLDIYGDGSVLRDYVEVSDVCRVIEHFISKPYHGRINVATGQSISIKDLIDVLAKALGILPKINFKKVEDISSPSDLVFDIARLNKIMPGFQFMDINDGINKYVCCLSKDSN